MSTLNPPFGPYDDGFRLTRDTDNDPARVFPMRRYIERHHRRRVPGDDEAFSGENYQYVYNDGRYMGGWPTEDELSWFPKDLIKKYNCSADYTGPDYDLLYFPEDADADAIAEDLRARGHTVEKDSGDLSDWLDLVGA